MGTKDTSIIDTLQEDLMDDLKEIRNDKQKIEKSTQICNHAMAVIKAEHVKALMLKGRGGFRRAK